MRSAWIDWRGALLAIGLGAAVFLIVSFCLAIPRSQDVHTLFWYANGLPFALLVRAPTRRWPLVFVGAATGIASAEWIHHGSLTHVLVQTASNGMLFGLSAYALRRQVGSHLDLTNLRHLLALAWSVAVVTGVVIAVRATVTVLSDPAIELRIGSALLWFLLACLNLFVLGLPALSLTASQAPKPFRLDARAAAVLALLLILEGVILALCFGPLTLPGVFVVMPVLMLIAWLYGLPGTGLANLIAVAIVGIFTYERFGSAAILERAGYPAIGSGLYLVLFFAVCQLISLPLAIARARQLALTQDLAVALSASEARAVQLEESERTARQAETQAVYARERLRRVIETSSDVICTLDADGRFVDISENCEGLWGRTRDTLLGRHFLEFIDPEEHTRILQLYERRTEPGIRQTVRTTHAREDGTTMPMSWSGTWVEDERMTHCVGRDMTDYDAMEARVHHAQRMEAIGQLTGGVAHDFNNLLTVVLGSCEEVALKTDDPHLRDMLEMALQAGERCAELTRQLLAFARRQNLVPQAFDVNEMIAAAAPLIMRTMRSDVEFSIRTSSDLHPAYADPLQTETAILNLCLNAGDAMPNGGKLLIETANARLTDVYAKRNPGAKAGDYVMITVKDNGTGIPANVLERIFEPFFTTKDVGHGTGLGLSMIHGFVSQSNGHVKIKSKPGKGTTFHLYLPVAGTAPGATVTGKTQAELREGREHILLAEDHPLVREHLHAKLSSMGYRVSLAVNGAEALAILEASTDIDLLLTDVVMPGCLDGFELGRQASARWPELRILYTSGYAPEMLAGRPRPEPIPLISKPYSKNDLATTIRSLLDAPALPTR